MQHDSGAYQDAVFWERKYAQLFRVEDDSECFDLYCQFEELFPTIEGLLSPGIPHRALIIGVGRSHVIDVLLSRGYTNITAIDVSPTLVAKLSSKYERFAGVEVLVMDVCLLSSLPDAAYTLVIDKGCLDALFCKVDFVRCVNAAYQEIYRVLRHQGILFSVSHAPPSARVPYMKDIEWTVLDHPLLEGEGLHLYTATKSMSEAVAGLDSSIIDVSESTEHRSLYVGDRPVVSSLAQSMNRCPRVRTKAHAGTLTVTASLQEMRDLIDSVTYT